MGVLSLFRYYAFLKKRDDTIMNTYFSNSLLNGIVNSRVKAVTVHGKQATTIKKRV